MQMKCCFLQFVCCCDLCFTRGEPNEKKEELGLIELIRSFRVGRQANSLAVIAESILINLLLAISISCTMIFSKQIRSLQKVLGFSICR